MYTIAVCDDEQYYLDEITNSITDIFTILNQEYNMEEFSCPKSLYEEILSNNKQYDMLILDILMGEDNGIELAKKIRIIDTNTVIVFLTSSPDFVFDGYDVLAAGYLLKPVDTNKLKKIIFKDIKTRNQIDYLTIKEKGITSKIYYKDIVFIESKGKKLDIITMDNKFSVYSKISDYVDKLPKTQFVNCHKSYIINLNHVKSIISTGFNTIQGYFVPISRSNYQMAKKSFIHFLGS